MALGSKADTSSGAPEAVAAVAATATQDRAQALVRVARPFRCAKQVQAAEQREQPPHAQEWAHCYLHRRTQLDLSRFRVYV